MARSTVPEQPEAVVDAVREVIVLAERRRLG
jgi:hypothetical protein